MHYVEDRRWYSVRVMDWDQVPQSGILSSRYQDARGKSGRKGRIARYWVVNDMTKAFLAHTIWGRWLTDTCIDYDVQVQSHPCWWKVRLDLRTAALAKLFHSQDFDLIKP